MSFSRTTNDRNAGEPADRRGQSPVGFLRALGARIRTAFCADMTADLLEEGLADLETGLSRAGESAGRTESLLQAYTRHFAEFMADGILTLRERAVLASDLVRVKRSSSATTRRIEELR